MIGVFEKWFHKGNRLPNCPCSDMNFRYAFSPSPGTTVNIFHGAIREDWFTRGIVWKWGYQIIDNAVLVAAGSGYRDEETCLKMARIDLESLRNN